MIYFNHKTTSFLMFSMLYAKFRYNRWADNFQWLNANGKDINLKISTESLISNELISSSSLMLRRENLTRFLLDFNWTEIQKSTWSLIFDSSSSTNELCDMKKTILRILSKHLADIVLRIFKIQQLFFLV